ncbi:TlpA family protein disulfide reductase [Thermomonas sp.]|uniref:TlpA family protein disulfide reductase n=1 Tax=Thermomonas sp. TaxID=1971895 RepID=UPI003D0B38A6
MRHVFIALLLWMASGLAQAAGPGVGQPAPAALGKARDGTPVSLEQFRGRIVVVTFWASWCAYCLKELPVLDSLQRHAEDLLQVVAVNVKDTPQDYRVMMRQMKGYRLLQARDIDGRIADGYGVTGYPSLWIIDREGRIAAHHSGYGEDSLKAIVDEINALLRAGGKVAMNPG